jgi:peptidoglycan hydrolase-like protein with peptidoglycan-binding domain
VPATDDAAVPTTTAFRRSQRASRARRAAAARRRRRLFRGRGAAFAATGLMVVCSAGAVAQERASTRPAAGASASVVVAAQKALGITADGIAGPQTRRAIKRFQRRNGLSVDGVVGPQTLKALGVKAPTSGSGRPSTGDAGGSLESIAQCESGGDPTAVSPDGRYKGKYQFDQATWERMGGQGDPAAAPEAEQDQRAAALMEAQGPGAWPNCA